MSSSKKILHSKVVDSVTFDQDRRSDALDVSSCEFITIQAIWSGGSTPVGVLKAEVSLDGTNYFELSTTSNISGNSGNTIIELANKSYKYLKVFLDFTSGSATISAWIHAKGV